MRKPEQHDSRVRLVKVGDGVREASLARACGSAGPAARWGSTPLLHVVCHVVMCLWWCCTCGCVWRTDLDEDLGEDEEA